ncbi:MAG TPA: hypothetical protein VEY11_08510 [Pyrinomonadaceae bacterium]|nr:hypothetical protein [Pyrinomonadaceae bacterium]
MKQITSFVLLAFLSHSILGQEKLREVDLRVSSIGSGTPYHAVIRNLGEPLQRKATRTAASLSCSEAAETDVTLLYAGLQISLLGNGEGRNLRVYSMEVSSPSWMVAGVRIGASREDVKNKFGEPFSKAEESGETIFHYVTKANLGMLNFHFRNNKLVKVAMTETLC